MLLFRIAGRSYLLTLCTINYKNTYLVLLLLNFVAGCRKKDSKHNKYQ
jgi:hypothetical protein